MKKLISLFLCIVTLFTCVTTAFAAEKDCSLTISYKDDKTPIPGAAISIYRVAALSDDKYVLTGDFRNDPVNIDISSDSASNGCAMALYGYAVANERTPVADGVTSDQGIVYFGSLDEGLYLIAIQGVFVNNDYYGDSYYLVTLPGIDSETREVVYDIISQPKTKVICSDSAAVTSIHVLKRWSDEGTHNPISVTLYRDGKAYDTQELNSDGEWRYIWDGLEIAHSYAVAETNVPDGYTVSVTREEDTFVITNTNNKIVVPTNPDDTTNPNTNTTQPDNPGSDDEPNHINPVVPAVVVPSVVITGVVIGTTAAIIPITIGVAVIAGVTIIGLPIIIYAVKHHAETQDENYGKTDEELPYTGVLWWPVPVMAAAGITFIIAGSKLKKKKHEDSE